MRCPVCFHNDHMNTRCYQEVCSCHTAMGQNPPRPPEGKPSLIGIEGEPGHESLVYRPRDIEEIKHRVDLHAKLLAALEALVNYLPGSEDLQDNDELTPLVRNAEALLQESRQEKLK